MQQGQDCPFWATADTHAADARSEVAHRMPIASVTPHERRTSGIGR